MSTIIGTAGDDSLVGTQFADSISGLDGDDEIRGLEGDDILDGGAGADSMEGGAGNDKYHVGNAFDQVIEDASGGVADTVYSTISYVLGDNLERLVLLGSDPIDATGNDQGNMLFGNSAANVFDGGGGQDYMNGSFGDDVYLVDFFDEVREYIGAGNDTIISSMSFLLPANVETLQLVGPEARDGWGNKLNNLLVGNSAANLLDGSAGADIMDGGAGDDTYHVGNRFDQAIEHAFGGRDTIFVIKNDFGYPGITAYVLPEHVEDLRLLDPETIGATGNDLNNLLVGNSASNVLDGREGADIMEGGAGNDRYYVGNAFDQVTENASEGNDTVYSTISYVLGANLDNVRLLGSEAIDATANARDNLLVGNSGANLLDGGAGADRLRGGADTDQLWGGSGIDEFVFAKGDFGGLVAESADRIHDFSQAEGDLIDLDQVDADSLVDGNQSFIFIGSDTFHNVAGELRYEHADGDTYIYGDTNGDGAADFLILLEGMASLTSGDLLL